MTTVKGNRAVWLAAAIPVVVIVLVALSIFVPRLLAHPGTDFVYVLADSHTGQEAEADYRVVAGRVTEAPTALYGNGSRGRLYRYDVRTNRSQALTLDQARALQLDDTSNSPDGFRTVYVDSTGNGLFPFDNGNGAAAVYLEGKAARLRLDITVGRSYEPTSFRFVGWVR